MTQTHIKMNGLIIESCKRKHGFVGMLNISCKVGDNNQLTSVDITPSIVSDTLGVYTALLRPRHYDNKKVGDDFYTGLELSSSQKDWDFLKFLQPEVMCGYTLVKMLRSMADTFQTDNGRVYTAEDILPSYMVKTALLWILDPEDKFSNIYKGLEMNSVFHGEYSSRSKADFLSLCQDLLQDLDVSGMDILDVIRLLDIWEKCTKGGRGRPIERDRILAYVLAVRRSDSQEQNGINLQCFYFQHRSVLMIDIGQHKDRALGNR